MPDPFDTYLPWFILREIPLIGNATIKKLINEFGSPKQVLNASRSRLSAVKRITLKMINNLQQYHKYEDAAQKELEQVLNKDFKLVCLTDRSYPVLLRHITDPPPILTFKGNLNNTSPCISMVGSRNATSYGLSTAGHLSFRLAQKGFQVVSGMARGIDTMAHKGALNAGGRTIAVLGSGLNKIYPKENIPLFYDIADSGCIFSEFKVNADPSPVNFPVRNRLIAGLSCGSIVVEAAKKSGSLITARLAGEYNREVFAVPGSIKSQKSAGTHHLLKQGAKLVETELDILDELHQFVHTETPAPVGRVGVRNIKPDKVSNSLLKFLDPYPVHIDILVEKSRLTSSDVSAFLLDLELQGLVTRHQGNYYSISEGNH